MVQSLCIWMVSYEIIYKACLFRFLPCHAGPLQLQLERIFDHLQCQAAGGCEADRAEIIKTDRQALDKTIDKL